MEFQFIGYGDDLNIYKYICYSLVLSTEVAPNKVR